MKRQRYLQQTERARIEHDLVLTRLGELMIRNTNALARGFLYDLATVDAVIVEGLISSPGAGLSVNLTIPAVALQKIPHGSLTNEVAFIGDENDGSVFNVALDAADPTNPRIDILEARIQTRSEFTDNNVSIADPVTKVISQTTRDRDFELYLNIQKVTGTPAGSPTPPSPTAATAGAITGTVDINTGTTDLSTEYILNLAVGLDEDFVEIDLRGATPAATTAAEILAAINAAGFGTVATLSGNFLKITAPGTGENSIVQIKQPLDSTTDAYAEVLGGTESAGYFDTFVGDNAFFKVAEIYVPAAAVSLTANDVRSREEKNSAITPWDADAATIVNGFSLGGHRSATPLDHPDGSIELDHLSAAAIAGLNVDVVDLENAHNVTRARLESAELKLLEQAIILGYLMQKTFISSDIFIETFIDVSQTADFEDSTNKAAWLMDDTDFRNNWKEREGNPDYKNGFIRPDREHYMLETIDQFDLQGVGHAGKCDISQYDSVNDCYWLMTYTGANNVGQVVQISPVMRDGAVQVKGRWYLPAGGVNTRWAGIEVANNGAVLFVGRQDDTTVAGNTVYRYVINGAGTSSITIGGAGFERSNGEILDIAVGDGPSHVENFLGSGEEIGLLNGITVWDANDIAILACSGATVNLVMWAQADLGVGTETNKTNLGFFVGGTLSNGRGVARNGNDLWVLMNDNTDNNRFVFKFDLTTDIDTSDAFHRASGRFKVANPQDHQTAVLGITVGKHGDILEIVDVGTQNFIARRALKNALWGENQLNSIIHTTDAGVNSNLMLCYDGSYVWYSANNNAGANLVVIYRRNLATGAEQSIAVTGGGWWTVGSMTWADVTGTDYFFILGYNGTTEISRAITRSTLEGALGGTLDLGTAGTAFTGFENKTQSDITNDGTYLYILCDTDDDIDRWTLAATPTKDTDSYINLIAPVNWRGLAWKNGQFYITWEDATFTRISVLDDAPFGSGYMVTHRHIGPAQGASLAYRLDFNGNNLGVMEPVSMILYETKVLDDSDVLQLHTFLEATNVLLTDGVFCNTPVVQRYFDPEDFNDLRDMPDKNYCVVGYVDEGFTILHLDEFLAGRSATGKHRYDVRDIRAQHFKRGTNNAFLGATNFAQCILVEKDMIFIGDAVSAGLMICDLKAGSFQLFGTGGGGNNYAGSLSERNDGLGFDGNNDAELGIGQIALKVHARTFTEDDPSDFSGENPVTFVTIGTNNVGCDLMRIDWDANNNRTIVKVWNRLGNNTDYGTRANWIAPSGIIFLGHYNAAGQIWRSSDPAWSIDTDNNTDFYQVGSGIVATHVSDIAPNSIAYKTATGDWRHYLLVKATPDDGASEEDKLLWIDVEDTGFELVTAYASNSARYRNTADLFEDMAFQTGTRFTGAVWWNIFLFHKKNRFTDGYPAPAGFWGLYNGWTVTEELQNDSRPRFARFLGYPYPGQTYIRAFIRYSGNHSMLTVSMTPAAGSAFGFQIFHFPHKDNCIHESNNLTVSNPATINFAKNAIEPQGEKLEIVLNTDLDITYTDGATATWGTGSDGRKQIARDGVTEGKFVWDNITGYVRAGLHFIKDDDSGGSKITVEDTTDAVTLTDWNGVLINHFHAEVGIDDDYTCWITLPDPTHTYKITVEHGGQNNAGGNDYLYFVEGFLIEQLTDANAQVDLELWHSDHPATIQSYTDLTSGVSGVTDKTQTDTANGIDTEFTLSGNNRAAAIVAFGQKATAAPEITWFSPDSPDLTWGTNSPNYDDETFDANGFTTVKWDTAPPAGNTYIKYTPKANLAKVRSTLVHPNDGSTFIDKRDALRLLDYALELI